MHRRFAAAEGGSRGAHGGPVLRDVLPQQDGPLLRILLHNRSLLNPVFTQYEAIGGDYAAERLAGAKNALHQENCVGEKIKRCRA